jgi:spore coat-associated protein N
MFRRSLYLVLALGITAGLVNLGSALFTDSQAVDANSFTSGTVILSTDPTTELVTFSNMAPADVVVAPITVSNDGSLDLRYSVKSLATNTDGKGLAAQLVLTIKSGVTACTLGGFAADGTEIYSGILGATPTATKLVGDAAAGQDTGDRVLPPTTLNSEVLCFQVQLPSDTGDAWQGAATSATFTFDAEQTKNNN